MDFADRQDWRRVNHSCDIGSPAESGIPDLLARSRVWPVRGKPAWPEGIQQREGVLELRSGAAAISDIQVPSPDPLRWVCASRSGFSVQRLCWRNELALW